MRRVGLPLRVDSGTEGSQVVVVAHVVVFADRGDAKVAHLNVLDGCFAALEDPLEEGVDGFFDQSSVFWEVAMLLAGWTHHVRHFLARVVIEVTVPILADIHEPLRTAHRIVEAQVGQAIRSAGRETHFILRIQLSSNY